MTRTSFDFIYSTLGKGGISIFAATVLINAASSLAFLYFPAWITSKLAANSLPESLSLGSIYLVVPLIISALLSSVGGMLGAYTNNNMRRKAKATLYKFVLSRPPLQRYEKNLSSGATDNLLETAAYAAREVCEEIYVTLAKVLATLGVVVYVIASIKAAFVLPLLLITAFVIGGSYFHQKINNFNIGAAVQSKAQVSRHIVDTIRNISLVEVSRTQDFEQSRLDHLLIEESRLFFKALTFQEFFITAHKLVTALLIGCLGIYMYLGLASPDLAVTQLMPVIFVLLFSGLQIELAGRSISNVGELSSKLSYALDELGFDGAPAEDAYLGRPAEEQFVFYPAIVKLDGVSFSYKNTLVLNNITLNVNIGDKIALVGASGAGKSTLAKIVAGLLPPSSGSYVTIHPGRRHQKLNPSIIKIYYIHQESPVLDRSLKDNICYGATHILNEQEVINILQSFGLSHLLERASAIDTPLGEMGLTLSGGERQRLSLARAYVAGADLLILDEATSALDIDSEAVLNKVLLTNFSETTTITIAHRYSSLNQSNRLIVLEDGHIVTDMPWSQSSEPPSSIERIYSISSQNS